MSVSLEAKQQTILEIFSGEKQYVIPHYQRAYSWGEEECKLLFEDLKEAYDEFKNDQNNEYFLGNIVIAGSREYQDRLEVIDGQQRLTTLTLLIKVLLHFDKDNSRLESAIEIPAERKGDTPKQRLLTTIMIKKDQHFLEEAIKTVLSDEVCKCTKEDSHFKKNLCYFYEEIKKFIQHYEIEDLVYFFLRKVYLLPIEVSATDADSAREKALRIFETINDRGLSLSDSDIFKAQIYNKALNDSKEDDFINRWNNFDSDCRDVAEIIATKQKNPIDEIFRIYSYIIRGEKNNKSREKGLRVFFLQDNNSPFKDKTYDEILNDLAKIIEAIEFVDEVINKVEKYNKLSKWFQLATLYINKYPLSILLVYLYKHGTEHTERLEKFSKDLVRFIYGSGTSISQMKDVLYDFAVKNMNELDFSFNMKLNGNASVNYNGSLKKGLSLLSLYLAPNQNSIEPYYFDKIISNDKDFDILDSSWKGKKFEKINNTLGNTIVLDIPKKNIQLKNKSQYLKKSSIAEIKNVSEKLLTWHYEDYTAREKELNQRLSAFFKETL